MTIETGPTGPEDAYDILSAELESRFRHLIEQGQVNIDPDTQNAFEDIPPEIFRGADGRGPFAEWTEGRVDYNLPDYDSVPMIPATARFAFHRWIRMPDDDRPYTHSQEITIVFGVLGTEVNVEETLHPTEDDKELAHHYAQLTPEEFAASVAVHSAVSDVSDIPVSYSDTLELPKIEALIYMVQQAIAPGSQTVPE